MQKILGAILLKLLGFKLVRPMPKEVKKAIVLMAPHTSNWDFYVGKAAFMKMGIVPKILIKKESFKGFIGPLLKGIGGVPVDRSKKTNLVKDIAKMFHENEEFFIIITPEGTRKYNPKWKLGFYNLAVEAKVPIIFGYLDYERRIGGLGPQFYPTGDVEKDLEEIKAFFRQFKGKYPDQGVR